MGSTIDTADRPFQQRRSRLASPGIRWRRRAAFAAVGTLALAACGGDDDDSASEPAAQEDFASDTAADESSDSSFDADESFEVAGEGAPTADRDVQAGDAGIDLGVIGRDVIIEMRIVLSSDDIERTVATIATDAAALGGGIASSNVDYGDARVNDPEFEEGYALLVVKVPPASIDQMLGRIGDAGTVQSINQSAQDVTEQLVDLDVRTSNARQSVETVRSFMERTDDLAELVALEAELTRRQTELERLEAQQRNLRDRVALSTITIEVLPAASVPEAVGDDGDDSLGDALRSGWDAFVAALFTIAFIAAVLLPFLLVAAVVGAAIWLVRRRPRDRTDAVTPIDTAPDTEDAADTDEDTHEPAPTVEAH